MALESVPTKKGLILNVMLQTNVRQTLPDVLYINISVVSNYSEIYHLIRNDAEMPPGINSNSVRLRQKMQSDGQN